MEGSAAFLNERKAPMIPLTRATALPPYHGLGIALGRDLRGEDYQWVSVIGAGALTGGMAYEALNNAARMKKNFIII